MRVATWNLLHGIDVRTRRVDIGVVADGIAALDADVVAVQEVDRELIRSGGIDQVGALADKLGWHGVFAPAGTAPEIVAKLNAGLNTVLRQPDIAARLKQLNVESRANTPEDFRAFVASEIDKWGKVVREANIKLG